MKKILLFFSILFITLDTIAQCNITGNITTASPTLPGMRLFRDGNSSNCALPKISCPGQTAPTNVYYATHSITNGTGTVQNVTALISADPTSCTGTNQIVVGVYNTTFDPFNVCSNYVADLGNSPEPSGNFCFTMPPNTTYVFAVMMANNGATCLGTGYNINVCSALPVNLVSFKGRLLSESNVGLFWQTSREENSSHFIIQRKINNGNYKALKEISTGENSTSLKDYTFYDNDLPTGHLYYRLKQIDIDNAYTYSDIVHINNNPRNDISPYILTNIIEQGSPLQMHFPNKYDALSSQIIVYSPTGNVLKKINREPNNKNLNISTDNLATGIYFVQIIEDGLEKKLKFVIK